MVEQADTLARNLNLPRAEAPEDSRFEMVLVPTPHRLELRVIGGDSSLRGGRPILVDLSRIDTRTPAGRRLKQPIAKAVGMHLYKETPPIVLEATAGFGHDTWLLASLGCKVVAVERSGLVAALLADGLDRAEPRQVTQRISLIVGESAAVMKDPPRPEVIWIDPMYPASRKAAQRKSMRVLRRLVGEDKDAADLLRQALLTAKRRVVVKRPLRAAPLGNRPPEASHKGQAVRYDVYPTLSSSGDQ